MHPAHTKFASASETTPATVTVLGWINVYRSGFWHSTGKPGTYDRHSGDFYATRDDALRDIHPASHYIGTVQIHWDETEPPSVNL